MKAILMLGLLLNSLNAVAGDLPSMEESSWTMNCAPVTVFEGDRPIGRYTLVNGYYSSSQQNQGWCANYKINEVLKYSCDNNVSSFLLACVDSGVNFKAQFKCDHQGVCKANDNEDRTINLNETGLKGIQYSRLSGGTRVKTQLSYTGPCESI